MPDAFGNPTPQEILFQLQQQRQQANPIGRGSPFQQAATNFERIFGAATAPFNPMVVQAERRQHALGQAREAAKAKIARLPDDASEIDKALITKQAQLEAVGGFDQGTADKLIEQIVQLSAQRDQMRRLQAQERREQTEFDLKVEEHGLLDFERKARMIVDQDTGRPITAIDLSKEGDLARYREIRQQNPNAVMRTMEDFANASDEDRRLRMRLNAELERAKKGAGASRAIEMRRFTADAKANNDFAATALGFIEVLEDSRGQFGLGGQAVSQLQRVGAHGQSLVAAVNPDAIDFNNSKIESKLEKANITDAKRRALVIDLAYAIATSREGGRLTDQDVDRAIQTIGAGEPDVRAVAEVFGELLERRADVWADQIDLYGLGDIEAMRSSNQIVLDRYSTATERLNKFRARFDPDKAATTAPSVRPLNANEVVITPVQ